MKKRIAYISLYFFTVLLIFILQKPLFMLYNGSIEKGFGFADYMQVMVHGASLDAATAGYLTAFPFLLVLISIWFRKFPFWEKLFFTLKGNRAKQLWHTRCWKAATGYCL
jgi:hypothetical protein